MRYFLIFLGFVLFIVFIFFTVMTSTVNLLSKCLTDYNSTLSQLFSIAKKEKLNKEIVCANGRRAIVSLSSCYEDVRNQSIIPLDVVFTVSKLIRMRSTGGDMKDVTKMHNSSCIDYPESRILYLDDRDVL